MSTVYRTLHVMTGMGILRELELAEDHKHYELNTASAEHHHHLICVHCNQTIEFTEDIIDYIGSKQANSMGYSLLDCQLNLYGVCADCQKNSQ